MVSTKRQPEEVVFPGDGFTALPRGGIDLGTVRDQQRTRLEAARRAWRKANQDAFRQWQPVAVTFEDGREEEGKVIYVRMSPPEYVEVGAVGVRLDSKRDEPGYHGTVFRADRVRPKDSP